MNKDFKDHAVKVAKVVSAVKSRPVGTKLTIRKNAKGHTPHDSSYKMNKHPVSVDHLDEILFLDEEKLVVYAEGQVTIGQLTAFLVPQGYCLAVVPEYRSFTVAGLVNGEGIQCSSHKYGLFGKTIKAVEVVCGDGSIVWATKDNQHSALLDQIRGSYGTVAICVSALIQVIPVKPYVATTYLHFSNVHDFASEYDKIVRDEKNKPTYIDAVALARGHFAIALGRFADLTPELESNPDAVFYNVMDEEVVQGREWFYQRMRNSRRGPRSRATAVDLIPTREFQHRSERGLYWMMEVIVDLPFVTESNWGRRVLDRKMWAQLKKTGFSDAAFTVEERERILVNQDLGTELERLEETLEIVMDELELFPIWICAIDTKGDCHLTSRCRNRVPRYIVDVGMYGEPKCKNFRNRKQLRKIQQFTHFPSDWGVSYISEEEYENHYDTAPLDAVRKKYHSKEAFVDRDSKIVFYDPNKKDLGRIPCWRLVRQWRVSKVDFALFFVSPVLAVFVSVAALLTTFLKCL